MGYSIRPTLESTGGLGPIVQCLSSFNWPNCLLILRLQRDQSLERHEAGSGLNDLHFGKDNNPLHFAQFYLYSFAYLFVQHHILLSVCCFIFLSFSNFVSQFPIKEKLLPTQCGKLLLHSLDSQFQSQQSACFD